jgi:hypothetical protein
MVTETMVRPEAGRSEVGPAEGRAWEGSRADGRPITFVTIEIVTLLSPLVEPDNREPGDINRCHRGRLVSSTSFPDEGQYH